LPGSPLVRKKLNPTQNEIARAILKEINERLGFLNNVGLDYIDLNRTRARSPAARASASASQPDSARACRAWLYVLDEPSIAFTSATTSGCCHVNRLRDLGNTVLVVEHDEDAIRHADYVIDMGPGAGVHGGHIGRHGKLEDVLASPTAHRRLYHRASFVPTRPRGGRDREEAHFARGHRDTISSRSPRRSRSARSPCVTGVSGWASRASPSTRSTPQPRAISTAPASRRPHEKVTGSTISTR